MADSLSRPTGANAKAFHILNINKDELVQAQHDDTSFESANSLESTRKYDIFVDICVGQDRIMLRERYGIEEFRRWDMTLHFLAPKNIRSHSTEISLAPNEDGDTRAIPIQNQANSRQRSI